MKLNVIRPGDPSTDADAVMEHNGQSIEWYYSTFKKQQSKGQQSAIALFDEINAYWAYLPKERQDQIFSVYQRIKQTFESHENVKALTRALIPLMTELYELHDLADIDHWIRFHSDIRIPENIKETFVESMTDTSVTRQKTYTKEDYQKLLTLALALRAAVPVWGEMIGITEKQKQLGTDWKEYVVYQLIWRSRLMHCEAMKKLRGYVQAYVPNEKRQLSAILAGIGTEDFPEWLLGVIVVRRVAIGDLSNTLNPESHLVSSIHSYIIAKLNPSESSFMGNIREKVNERDGQDSENKLSRLEGYKIRQELSEGDVRIIAKYASDPYAVALRACPNVPREYVEMSLESVKALEPHHVQPPQLSIMQMVLKRAVPPRGLEYLDKRVFLGCLAATQAILWMQRPKEGKDLNDQNYHYRDLAGLVSAIAVLDTGDEVEASMTSHGRIPKDLVEELTRLYPYPLRMGGRQQRDGGGKTVNVAVQNIDSLVKQFDKCAWRLTLPSEWVKELDTRTGRRYPVPYEIRGKLASLAIDVEKRSL